MRNDLIARYKALRLNWKSQSSLVIAAWLVFVIRLFTEGVIYLVNGSALEFGKNVLCALLLPAAVNHAFVTCVRRDRHGFRPFLLHALSLLAVTGAAMIAVRAMAGSDRSVTAYVTMSVLGACIGYAACLPLFMTLFRPFGRPEGKDGRA